MSLARDIVTAALAMSSKNRPVLANQENELRLVVTRALREYWSAGIEVNPRYFATFKAVPPETNTWAQGFWPRPADAEAVFEITGAGSALVRVAPWDQVGSFAGTPVVTRWGGGYLGLGIGWTPTVSDTLTLFYARRPVDPATLDTALDSTWPEAYDTLLVLEVAMYLARKDGRVDDLPALAAERDAWKALYLQFLRHETMGEQRIFHPERYTELTQKPLGGGSAT